MKDYRIPVSVAVPAAIGLLGVLWLLRRKSGSGENAKRASQALPKEERHVTQWNDKAQLEQRTQHVQQENITVSQRKIPDNRARQRGSSDLKPQDLSDLPKAIKHAVSTSYDKSDVVLSRDVDGGQTYYEAHAHVTHCGESDNLASSHREHLITTTMGEDLQEVHVRLTKTGFNSQSFNSGSTHQFAGSTHQFDSADKSEVVEDAFAHNNSASLLQASLVDTDHLQRTADLQLKTPTSSPYSYNAGTVEPCPQMKHAGTVETCPQMKHAGTGCHGSHAEILQPPVWDQYGETLESSSKLDRDALLRVGEQLVDSSQQQSTVMSSLQQPTVMSSLQQPTGLSSLQQPTGLSSLQQPTGLSSLQQPTGLSSLQQPTGLSSLQQPTGLSSLQQPTGLSSLQQPTGLSSLQQPTGLSSLQQPTGLSSLQQPTGLSSLQQPTVIPSLQQVILISPAVPPSDPSCSAGSQSNVQNPSPTTSDLNLNKNMEQVDANEATHPFNTSDLNLVSELSGQINTSDLNLVSELSGQINTSDLNLVSELSGQINTSDLNLVSELSGQINTSDLNLVSELSGQINTSDLNLVSELSGQINTSDLNLVSELSGQINTSDLNLVSELSGQINTSDLNLVSELSGQINTSDLNLVSELSGQINTSDLDLVSELITRTTAIRTEDTISSSRTHPVSSNERLVCDWAEATSPTSHWIPKTLLSSTDILEPEEEVESIWGIDLTMDTNHSTALSPVDIHSFDADKLFGQTTISSDLNNEDGASPWTTSLADSTTARSESDNAAEALSSESSKDSPVKSSSPACDSNSEGSNDSGRGGSEHDVAYQVSETLVHFELNMPSDLCGRFIGKQGKNINYLKNKTGAHVSLTNNPYTPDYQICQVVGNQTEVDDALAMIRRKFPLADYPLLTMVPVNMSPPPPVVLQPDHQLIIPDVMQLSLPEGVSVDVFVSAIVDAGHLFVQQPTHRSFMSLEKLNYFLNLVYSQDPNVPCVPTPVESGIICVCENDGFWYRAMIMIPEDENGESQVKFVDYGGYAVVPVSSLKQIRADFMSLPFQAVECFMANVTPNQNEQFFSEEGTVALSEMTQGKLLQCQVVARIENGIPYIHLYQISTESNSAVMINRALVNSRLVRWIEIL